MTLIRVQHQKNYTVINNSISKDSRLSYKAKGIWMYAFSRPDDWQFYVHEIASHATDGETAIKSGLKELEDCGYLVRSQGQSPDGKFKKAEYVFFETPQQGEEFKKCLPRVGNPPAVNLTLLNTEETNQNTTYSLMNNNREGPPKVPHPKPNEDVVVVSSCEDEELKRAVLDKVDGLSASVMKRAMRHTLEQVLQAVECLEQLSRVKCVNKFLTAALNNGWRPNEGVVKKEPETTLFKAIVLKASEVARELVSGFTATMNRISHDMLPGSLKTSDGANSVSEWLDKLFSMLGYDIRATEFLSDIDIYEEKVRELTA